MSAGDGGPSDDSRLVPDREQLDRLLQSGIANALLSWLLVGLLGLTFIESVLDADLQWIVFTGAASVIILLPPLANREWHVMLPWEVLGMALFPIIIRALVGGSPGTFATYLSVATLALVMTVELHMFTSLRVTHWFAVGFVVLTTMASVALWTIVRWNFDHYLGTSYLTTNEALMAEWVSVTLAGLVAGILFDSYFRQRDKQLLRAIRKVRVR